MVYLVTTWVVSKAIGLQQFYCIGLHGSSLILTSIFTHKTCHNWAELGGHGPDANLFCIMHAAPFQYPRWITVAYMLIAKSYTYIFYINCTFLLFEEDDYRYTFKTVECFNAQIKSSLLSIKCIRWHARTCCDGINYMEFRMSEMPYVHVSATLAITPTYMI